MTPRLKRIRQTAIENVSDAMIALTVTGGSIPGSIAVLVASRVLTTIHGQLRAATSAKQATF